MNYFERAVSRTTGVGIVVALSIIPGFVVGLIGVMAGGGGGWMALALLGPLAALVTHTPLSFLFAQLAKIPFSILFVGPILLGHWLFVKPMAALALNKGWVVVLEE